MGKGKENSPEALHEHAIHAGASLRQKAEKQIKKKHSKKETPLNAHTSLSTLGGSETDNMKLLHELQVHQMELEMQNEELRIAEEKAKTSAEKYTALYDFAPAGYFTLSYDGTIYGLNLNGARMLCKERNQLVNNNFRVFVAQDTLLDFDDFLQKVFESNARESCELRLNVNGNLSIFVHLEGIVSEEEQKCLVTAIDITRRKLAEKTLEESEASLRDLNATKDKFFSIIAHDLKNPFITIIGFSEMLAEQVHEKIYHYIR